MSDKEKKEKLSLALKKNLKKRKVLQKKIKKKSVSVVKPPKRWPVTIIGSSFRLTVKYPKSPWQQMNIKSPTAQYLIFLFSFCLKDK